MTTKPEWPENVYIVKMMIEGNYRTRIYDLTDAQAEVCRKALMEGGSATIAPMSGEPERWCPSCGGNDENHPCAYPSENKRGCMRDERLRSSVPSSSSISEICSMIKDCQYLSKDEVMRVLDAAGVKYHE